MSQTSSKEEQVLGKAYDVKLAKRLWKFVRPHKKLLIFALILIPISTAFTLAQPRLLKIAIDDYIGIKKTDGLTWIALLYIGCVTMSALITFAQLYLLQHLGQRSMHDLRIATYRHVLQLRSGFFDRVPIGRVLTRMTNDVENINEMFAAGVVLLIADAFLLLGIVGAMAQLNAKLTLITFTVVPPLILLVLWSRNIMRKSFRQIRLKLASMNAYVAEHLSGLAIVQLFARQKPAAEDYDKINGEYRNAYLGAIRADAIMYAIVEAVGIVSAALIAWYAGANIGEGGLTVGLVVAFVEYVNRFFIPVKDLSAKYAVMQSAMAATERIVSLLDTDEPDAPARESTNTEPPSETLEGDVVIAYENVEFSYKAGEPILRNVSLSVDRGETVAVVGATGSGKSTLIRLLSRLYEPTGGKITFHGRNILDWDPADLRARITVVSQDAFLFAGTVAENIRLGAQGSSTVEVEAALRDVGAESLLNREKNVEEMKVIERATNYSAGEKQLIAFARALRRNPEILILDEATAHVDPDAEAQIEKGLAALMQGRTTLVIAHRLSTIRRADRIIVMANGVIAECGTREELLEKNAIYARLERSFQETY